MSVDNTLTRSKNQLIAALPAAEYERLVPHLQIVRLSNQQVIYEIAEPIAYAYFPDQAIISLLTMMNDGSTVEVALVGHEGMAGIPIILGDNISSIRAIVQVSGYGVRINADVLKTEFARGGSLQRLLLRYVQAVITELAQGTACNRRHRLEKRLACWLLKVSDRIGSQEFPLTQEFIAEMLGVRRSGVTVAAGILSQSGIISYHRGHITILDRKALEATSCECYQTVKAEFTRLLGDLAVCTHR
ncbi:Crp/Fnr family transcriptional regulator [Nostoc sp. T09]|uniref:Crp/Fnr family transcriptional regulator n=1 Tax=Nostoc sp. T09 TaxID=1932621 RepID=UPI000A3A70FE|nr:Crp/Fnr family transcriptional regulator [Nostoc sp. T09]OUL23846.1 Crp/Fnr family transcriptional regulator [Nostoc sp. T09]